jgi:hypothetical protein
VNAVIEIRDRRSLRALYPTGASAESHRHNLTADYRAATRFSDDELEEEIRFWQSMLDSPDVEVAAVE